MTHSTGTQPIFGKKKPAPKRFLTAATAFFTAAVTATGLAAVASTASPPAAHAVTQVDSFFTPPSAKPAIVGVNYHPFWSTYNDSGVRNAILDRMQQAGVKQVRMDVSWTRIEKTAKNQYDAGELAALDVRVQEIVNHGMTFVGMVWNAPKWATGKEDPNYPGFGLPNAQPLNPADYGDFLAFLANRYPTQSSGWEMWNEPDDPNFWSSGVPGETKAHRAAAYANLVKGAYPQAKTKNPAGKYVLGSPVGIGLVDLGDGQGGWFKHLYSVAGFAGKYDALTVHPYVQPADQDPAVVTGDYSVKDLTRVIALMNQYGDGAKKIWATEFGSSTHTNYTIDSSPANNWRRGVTGKQQAQYLTNELSVLGSFPQVEAAFAYTDRDIDNVDVQNANYGLLSNNGDLSPKLAYYALKCAVGTAANPCLTAPKTYNVVTDFGAHGDGITDDTDAIQTAFDALNPGDTLIFPGGKTFVYTKTSTYKHPGYVLTVAKPGVHITSDGAGATLLSKNEQTSEVFLNAGYITFDNLTVKSAGTTRRWDEYEKVGVRLGEHDSITVNNVTVDGVGAAGIYVGGSRNFTISNVTVSNTRADSVHITEGASYGTVTNVTSDNSGDDGVSVVSYTADDGPVNNVTVTNATVNNQLWGRAFTVVGGDNIVFRNVTSNRSAGAALYIAAEKEWNTRAATNIQLDGAVFTGSNTASKPGTLPTVVDHGAIVVYNSQPNTTNSNILIKNVTIADTQLDASAQTSLITDTSSSGATQNNIMLSNINILRGPATPFRAVGVPAGAYAKGNWTVDTVPLWPQNSIGPLTATAYTAPKVAAGSVTTVHTGMPKTVVGGNVTVVTPDGAGHTTVFPATDTGCSPANMPSTSTNNFTAAQTIANFVTTRTNSSGDFCIYTTTATHLLWDQTFTAENIDMLKPSPTRMFDSVTSLPYRTQTKIRAGAPNATVMGNLTVANAAGQGFTSVYPCTNGIPTDQYGNPNTSVNNYITGQTIPNFAVIKADINGDICIWNSNTARIIWDQYSDDSKIVPAVTAHKILDTRLTASLAGGNPVAAGSVTKIHAGAANTTVAGNLTVTQPAGAGHTTIYPCNQTRPTTSVSNFVAGQTIPSFTVVKTDLNGDFCVYTTTVTHLLWDQSADVFNQPETVLGMWPHPVFTTAVPIRRLDTRVP